MPAASYPIQVFNTISTLYNILLYCVFHCTMTYCYWLSLLEMDPTVHIDYHMTYAVY